MSNGYTVGSNGSAKLNGSGRRPPESDSKKAIAALVKQEKAREVGKLAKSMSEDYQVKFGLTVLQANLQAIPVTVSADSGDSRAQALAEQLSKLWNASLSSMFPAIEYGRVAFEKVFAYDETSHLTTIRKLDPLPFDHTEMVLDKETGDFQGIKINAGDKSATLDTWSSWWLALDATSIEPHGKSRLSGAAFRTYQERLATRRLRRTFLRRFAIGWAKAHVESTYTDPNTGETVDGHERIQSAYEAMEAAGLMTFDNARTVKPDGTEGDYKDDIEQLPVPAGSDPIDNTLDGLDVEQLRSIGIPEKTVTEGESVGSFAMVSQQMRTLLAVVDSILSQLVESFQKYVVDAAVSLNWLDNAPGIVVSYPPITEGPTSLATEIVKAILTGTASPIVFSGAIDIPQLFEQTGVPTTPILAEIMSDPTRREKLLPAPAPAPLPPSQFGLSLGEGRYLEEDAPPLPDSPRAFLSELPTRRSLVEDGLDTLDDLFRELVDAAARRDIPAVEEAQKKIRELRSSMAVAGHLLGMLSPWRPSVASNPAGASRSRSINLALDLSRFDFPWFADALDFLRTKRLLSDEDFSLLDQDERAKALSAPGADDRSTLEGIQRALGESLKAGEPLDKFRSRLDEVVALPKAQAETLFRTQTKQAYIAGQSRSLSDPVIAEEFPYVEFAATADTRVRDSHWELNRKIARLGSPEHRLFLRAVADYNCRCTLIPLTEKEALRKGVSSLRDIPSTARSQYANP